jgi:hypothetical protein
MQWAGLYGVGFRWHLVPSPLPPMWNMASLLIDEMLTFVCFALLQGALESMMKCAEDQCPHVLADDRVQGEIKKMCREKNFLGPEFIRTSVVEQAGADIMNKVKSVHWQDEFVFV